jgi:predicted GH43/DUF377 family glycosyl hydrolase
MPRRIKNLFLLLDDKKIFLFYQAADKLEKKIKMAESSDGCHFGAISKKIILNNKKSEKTDGFQAARLGDKFFLIWKEKNKILGAVSTNPSKWEQIGQLSGLKNTGIVVSNFYYDEDRILYFNDKKSVKIAYSTDLKKWRVENKKELFKTRRGKFDSDALQPAGAFIRDEGIFLAYYGWDKNKKFSIGLSLFNKDNPEELLWRADEALWSQDGKEKITPLSIIDRNGCLMFYYENSQGELISVFLPAVWGWKNAQPYPVRKIFKKSKKNPLFGPRPENSWESVAAFNPTAFQHNGKIYLLYRALGDNNISVIGLATSTDGITIDERLDEPIYVPRAGFEGASGGINPAIAESYASGGGWGGCEDPRVIKIGKRLYIVYAAFNGATEMNIALSSIPIDDFLNRKWSAWKRPVLITNELIHTKNPAAVKELVADRPWTKITGEKDPAILPEKINGKYVIFHRIWPNIVYDYVDTLNFDGKKFLRGENIIRIRPKMWDSQKISMGCSPLKIKEGWLAIYNGVDKKDSGKYKIGAMILDAKDPGKVLYRCSQPIIEPEESYENNGHKFGIAFVGGSTIKDGQLFIYYGGSDKYACVATAPLDEFVKALIEEESPKMTKAKIIL